MSKIGMKRIIHCIATFMMLLSLLSSCERHDFLETKIHYADATINGYSLIDEHTLRETGYNNPLPFASGQRLSITEDGLALMQFKFVGVGNPSEVIYLFGGVAIPEGETFPELKRTYEIKTDCNFIPNKGLTYYSDYVQNYLMNETDHTSCGTFMMSRFKLTDLSYEYSTSLGGTIVFDSYDSKKGKYSGSFDFYSKDDIYKFDISLTGTFNVPVVSMKAE